MNDHYSLCIKVYQPFLLKWYENGRYLTTAHVLFTNTEPMDENDHSRYYELYNLRAWWCVLTQNTWCFFSCSLAEKRSDTFSYLPIKLLRVCVASKYSKEKSVKPEQRQLNEGKQLFARCRSWNRGRFCKTKTQLLAWDKATVTVANKTQ